MVRSLLSRGMLVGLLAGLLVFGFARVFGEPQVDRAIAFETAMDAAEARADAARGIHHAPEPELVSRPLQAGWGLLTGVLVYSTAFGGLFALVFALADGRMVPAGAPPLGTRTVSAVLGVCGFVAFHLVPNLKYPANPPSVGLPATIGVRTECYAVMLAVSVAAMVGAVLLRRHLAAGRDPWFAAIAAAAFFVGGVSVAAALLPAIDEVPAAFPATLLWRFRIDSLAMQLILWTALGLGFGAVAERTPRPGAARGSRLPPTVR